MADWLKNICLSPFKYGLNGINIVAMNAISIIFNLCGKRLFKIESDKIIKSSEYKDERDIFYMYPLQFQQMEQDIGLNIIRLESGNINNLIISVPWKELLAKPTLITIDEINLNISYMQNQNSIYINSLENTNSYLFSSKNHIEENQDLMNAYKEIKTLLSQYFDKINLEIKMLEINIINHFKIQLSGITYSNGIVNIDTLYVYTLYDDTDVIYKLVAIENIMFELDKNRIIVDKIFVDPVIIDYCPQYYTDNTKKDFLFDIQVKLFQMNQIMVSELSAIITNDNIIINNISRIGIDNILDLMTDTNTNSDFIIYDISKNMCRFNKNINLKISSFDDMLQSLELIKNIINNLSNKLVVIEHLDKNGISEIKKQGIQINNISSNIVYGDDIFGVEINELVCNENIEASRIKIIYDDMLIRINYLIRHHNGMIVLFDSDIKSDSFHLSASESKFIKNNNCININFDHAKASNITEIIDFVTKSIEKFTNRQSKENIDKLDLSLSVTDLSTIIDDCNEKKEPLLVNLNLANTDLSIIYEKIFFNVIITSANISITEQTAKKVVADLLLNNYLVARLQAEHISTKDVLLNSLHVYIDPEIFDQFNYICGTLTPEQQETSDLPVEFSLDGLKQLQEALYRSVILDSDYCQPIASKSIDEANLTFQKVHQLNYSNTTDKPQINFFTTSIANLYSVLIDDYASDINKTHDIDFKIIISTFHCYFFDKLLISSDKNKGSPAFLCAILKNLEFKKSKELAKEDKNKPLISVYEKGRKSKPKHLDKYSLRIDTGVLIDVQSRDPEWKYFVKFSKENMLNAHVVMHGDTMKSTINITQITTNIREETLLRLLAFFSHGHHIPKSEKYLHIEYFRISGVDLTINYCPLIIKKMGVDSNVFALKNFKLKLSPHVIKNTDSIDNLSKIVMNKIINEINPDNVLQFVPNIRVIQPYAVPMIDFFNLTKRYFNNPDNKRKIRMITKSISKGADIISALVKNNVEQVLELFN